MLYEINYLVLQSKTAELEKIKKETKKFIESFGAEILEEKEYLKRKLAYEIQHENYGFFTVLRFEFKKSISLDELKNKLNQKNEVARYIIVRADELPSLKEQEKEKMELNNKKSIKSEDVEKAIKEEERKTAPVEEKTSKKKIKIETPEKTEKKEDSAKTTADKKKTDTKEEEPKPAKKKVAKKVAEKETIKKKAESKKVDQEKDEISLDELDKKLDEILNS